MTRPAHALWLALFSSVAVADGASTRDGSIAIDRWTTADGLPQGSVTGLAQTRDGYLWMTTFGGIARFDGVSFDVFDLANHPTLGAQRFVGVVEDRRGDLYFGAQDDRVIRRRGDTFTTLAVPGAPTGAVFGPVVDPAGTVWALIGPTLVRVDGDRVTSELLPERRELGLQLDAAGALWIVAVEGVACWSGPCAAPRAWSVPGAAWLTTTASVSGGARWNDAWGSLPRCPPPSTRGTWAHVFWWDAREWCARDRELVARAGPTRVDLTARAPWETHDVIGVAAVLEDREGLLWIGTAGGGLLQVRERHLVRVGRAEGLGGESVWGMGEDDQGRLWLDESGTARVLVGGVVAPVPAEIAPIQPLQALAADRDGTVWMIAKETNTLHSYGRPGLAPIDTRALPPGVLRAVYPVESGALWIAIEGAGAVVLRDGAWGERWSEAALGGRVTAAREDRAGGTWFGTTGGVAHVLNGAVTLYGPDRGVGPGTVRDLFITETGAVWAGAYGGGLTRIDHGVVARVTRAQGLCDDVASRLIDDGRGKLWINGNRGISRVMRADLRAVADGHHDTVQCTLLESGEGNGSGGLVARDGRLWFPTTHGVVAVDPADYREPTAPIAHIASARLGSRLLADGQEVPSSHDDLEVQMTALSFVEPQDLYFRYRLRGYDEDWVEAGSHRVARYTHLPYGQYRFELKARSVSGTWSATVARAFVIQPELHERPRFYVACALLFVALVWGVALLRTASIRRHNRVLQREVEEREKIAAALRAQEAHYRALFEGTSDGLFVHATDGRLVEINPAGCAMIGLDRAAALGAPALAHVDATARETFLVLLTGGARGPVEARFVSKDGAPVEVRLQAAPLLGRPDARVLVSATDLTAERTAEQERRELEKQLRQSQKLEALGQLAGGIAHDFNNLLTAIGVEASLIQGADEDDKEAARNITSVVERAAALTKKLLVFGRKDHNKPVVIVLQERVQELMSVLRRTVAADITLNLVSEGAPLRVRIDPVRLEQTIINLVVNARDAITGAGAITIAIEPTELPEEETTRRGTPPGGYAVVSVSDTGCGIDEAVVERIFEPFFTTKDVGKGSGLGLAIVHAAMREANGFVTVKSERGQGSIFRLHFPLVESVPDRPVGPELPIADGRGRTVLLCDDEVVVRRAAARALRRAGYRVLETSSPTDALAMAETEHGKIEVLITDVVMPVMSGAELARRIRERSPDLPVLFISGHRRDVVLDRGVGGEAELLAKPFTMDVLVRRVGTMRRP